jgi:hypothetical protein
MAIGLVDDLIEALSCFLLQLASYSAKCIRKVMILGDWSAQI